MGQHHWVPTRDRYQILFRLLAFDLSLVLQHGHIISDVEKNNAHKEHHLCPILYFKLLGNDIRLNLIHNPLHVCAIIFQSLANIFNKLSKSLPSYFPKKICDRFGYNLAKSS